MTGQASPKDVESVLTDRYWLTPAGWAATEPHNSNIETSQENA
jgi:hypothetical protein